VALSGRLLVDIRHIETASSSLESIRRRSADFLIWSQVEVRESPSVVSLHDLLAVALPIGATISIEKNKAASNWRCRLVND
jgi:hypothetical protein